MDGNQLLERCLQVDCPFIIGYMSVDVRRDYYHDLSQLKYLTSIPKGKIRYNLNHNIDKAVKRTTDDNNEKISLMLKFLLNQRSRLEFLLSNQPERTFITYRRSLISVMCASYNHEPLSIVASLFNNCIYLCSIENSQVKKSIPPSDRNAKFCAWGYKFEQYMLSDSPIQQPNIEKPVVENEEFSIYYSSQLGKHKLFYGAQIDGMLATRTTSGPADLNNVNANLAYLRNNKFVELKTNREITSKRQEQNFKRFKLLRCWCQCYLAGLKGLLVGYRNDEGIIQRVQCFDTDDIVRYCRDEWKPQIAINYLDYFLTYVENYFKSLKETSDDDFISKEPITLKFDIDDNQKITVSKDIQEEHVILPECLRRKIQACGLSARYGADSNFAVQMRCYIAFAYLPAEDIPNIFRQFKDTLFPEEAEEVTNYFEEYYVLGRLISRNIDDKIQVLRLQPLFPPGLWSIERNNNLSLPRTQNSVEAWHRRWNSLNAISAILKKKVQWARLNLLEL